MKKLLAIFWLFSIAFLFTNCKDEEETIIDPLSISYEKTDVTTYGGNDGTITLTVTGGKEPITYSWSNGETTKDIMNLTAGIYTVTVSDAALQKATDTIEILSPYLIISDSVIMGAGYANDIYFSMTNGIVKTVSRTAWDIAFYSNPMSSTIITNDGNKVVLYVYPKGDKNNWNDAMDTTGITTWRKMYNTYTDSSWQNGAFDKGALGHPDYGWGVYDMTSHSVFGDSIHIIQLADKSYKKLFIEKRDATTNSYIVKYADLNGQNEQTATISCKNDLNKNFVYFSLAQNQVIDHEPVSADWDLVFTKYWDESIPYLVTGVLTNQGIGVAEMIRTDTASNNYQTANYAYNLMTIGSDWKTFNGQTYTYDITADLLYYVKNSEGNYFKIVFTGFDYSNGKFEYVLTKY